MGPAGSPQRAAARALGMAAAAWDYWQNHYDAYKWSDLVRHGHDVHYAGLGWSAAAWDGTTGPPATEGWPWAGLTEGER